MLLIRPCAWGFRDLHGEYRHVTVLGTLDQCKYRFHITDTMRVFSSEFALECFAIRNDRFGKYAVVKTGEHVKDNNWRVALKSRGTRVPTWVGSQWLPQTVITIARPAFGGQPFLLDRPSNTEKKAGRNESLADLLDDQLTLWFDNAGFLVHGDYTRYGVTFEDFVGIPGEHVDSVKV